MHHKLPEDIMTKDLESKLPVIVVRPTRSLSRSGCLRSSTFGPPSRQNNCCNKDRIQPLPMLVSQNYKEGLVMALLIYSVLAKAKEGDRSSKDEVAVSFHAPSRDCHCLD